MDLMDADELRAPYGGPPVLDPAALAAIADQLHDPSAAQRVAAAYLDKLDGRVSRLCAALEAGDPEPAMDAVLSLKVSSATVGARELERMAGAVETALRDGQASAARRLGRHLPATAARARDALRARLG